MPVIVTPITSPAKTVGEGPHWEESTQSLIYVDIAVGDVRRWNHTTNDDVRILHFDGTVGFVVPRKAGGFVVGLNRTLVHVDENNQLIKQYGDEVDADTNNRFNDGKCDPRGRVWAGTMDQEKTPGTAKPEQGALYRLDINGDVTKQIEKVTISNGLAWTADSKIMYYIDSIPRKIFAFDFDVDNGNISNRRVAVDFGDMSTITTLGYPDGMTIDTEGKLWVACFGVGKVIRFDPETGKEMESIDFPVERVTSCCFGGPNYDELFVTSSQHGLTEEQIKETPLAGACFKVTGMNARGFAPFVYEG